MSCPCHSHKPYSNCCEPLHKGAAPANATALMRSRYAAYAMGNVDYILKTTHPDHPDSRVSADQRKKQIRQFCKSTRFDDLKILDAEDGQPFSTVTFHAHLSQEGVDCSFTEKSTFAQINARWLYLKGERR